MCFIEDMISLAPAIKSGASRVVGISRQRFIDRLVWLSALAKTDIYLTKDDRKKSTYSRLKNTLESLLLDSSDGTVRKQPYVVLLTGPPGTGKTSFAYHIAEACMKARYKEFYPTDLVVLNETDQYQSEYRTNHKVVIFDDIAAEKDSPEVDNPWRKIIDFVNNIKKTSLNPNVELKGNVYIEPDLVILTSNRNPKNLGVVSRMIAPGAIYRRIKKTFYTNKSFELCHEVTLTEHSIDTNKKRSSLDKLDHVASDDCHIFDIDKKAMYRDIAVFQIVGDFCDHMSDQQNFVDSINSKFTNTNLERKSFWRSLKNDIQQTGWYNFLGLPPLIPKRVLVAQSGIEQDIPSSISRVTRSPPVRETNDLGPDFHGFDYLSHVINLMRPKIYNLDFIENILPYCYNIDRDAMLYYNGTIWYYVLHEKCFTLDSTLISVQTPIYSYGLTRDHLDIIFRDWKLDRLLFLERNLIPDLVVSSADILRTNQLDSNSLLPQSGVSGTIVSESDGSLQLREQLFGKTHRKTSYSCTYYMCKNDESQAGKHTVPKSIRIEFDLPSICEEEDSLCINSSSQLVGDEISVISENPSLEGIKEQVTCEMVPDSFIKTFTTAKMEEYPLEQSIFETKAYRKVLKNCQRKIPEMGGRGHIFYDSSSLLAYQVIRRAWHAKCSIIGVETDIDGLTCDSSFMIDDIAVLVEAKTCMDGRNQLKRVLRSYHASGKPVIGIFINYYGFAVMSSLEVQDKDNILAAKIAGAVFKFLGKHGKYFGTNIPFTKLSKLILPYKPPKKLFN